MAETDLRNELKVLKRRRKQLEREMAKLQADPVGEGRRLLEADARRQRAIQRAIASGGYAGGLLKMLDDGPRPRGRPTNLNSVRRQLGAKIRKLPYNSAAGKSSRKIAKLLGAGNDDNYKHQQVDDLINWIMENFTLPIPGESRKSRRKRALDIILRSKLEE